MAPITRDSGGSGRRKSISIFSRAALASSFTQANGDGGYDDADDAGHREREKKKLTKRGSIFSVTSGTSPELHQEGSLSSVERSSSPKPRTRTLQKSRPSSIFGSLGRKSATYVDGEDESDTLYSPASDSPGEGQLDLASSMSSSTTVLHHGEVQTTIGMFRKKKEYLVLTETHLIRFKSQSRAAEIYPSVPPAPSRANGTRHPSTTSIGSLQEIQSNHSHSSADFDSRIPLSQIVTAYKVEDGRPFFTTEVIYLDEEHYGVGSIQLMLHDHKEADLWHSSIRTAAQKARLMSPEPYPKRIVRYLVRVLETDNDYDANHFQVFRVLRRAPVPKSGRSSSDDLQKLGASVFYMVIGINRLHMIPLPEFGNSNGRLSIPKGGKNVFGLTTLVAMNASYSDDRFELCFRMPLQPIKLLELASSDPTDIAVVIAKACQYLRPQWLESVYSFSGPRQLLELADHTLIEEEEYGSFDRTLTAYCMAYHCNPVNIQYAVDWEAEDAPEFRLFPPATTPKYSLLELLAIMRALRYNESFHSISFKDINLHSMHGLYDGYGVDHIASSTRAGLSIQKYFNIKPQERSLLYQEVQAIALKSARLRRMDFSGCLPRRRPKDTFDVEGQEVEKDPGCEIVAALLPLCRARLTNVSWIILSGIELGETDLDDIIPALDEPKARIRAIECSKSGLNDRGIMQLLGHLERQNSTLECINIADNPGRIHLERFQVSMSRFSKIRRLDLSRITRTLGDEPLIVPEVLLSWKLEELIMNGVPVNDRTLDTISGYLMSDMSQSLRILEMEQCNMTGSHVALLMRSMAKDAGVARNLQLHVSANRLEKGVGEIVKAIEENHTPSHLIVRMIEFAKEDHFKQLLEALRTNTTIRSLDISKASLPYDAGPETCDALRMLFAENTTLEELDISGEQAHLEVARFGIGLNQALTGLKKNTALKMLRIEYQNLGMEGANTLSSVLEENTTLTHIHCEHNDINLQGFTILVNAIAKNFTVLELPFFRDDQEQSMKRMNANMKQFRRPEVNSNNDHVKSSVRRTLNAFGVSKPQKPELTPQDFDAVARVLGEKWEIEIHRLAMFLDRNNRISVGVDGAALDLEGLLSPEAMRPTTAMSDRGILEQALSNATPKVEHGNPVDIAADNLAGLGISPAAGEAGNGDTSPKTADTTPKKANRGEKSLLELPTIAREKVFTMDGGFFSLES